MGLVTCPDCGTSLSDRAPACPKCGAPRTAGSASPIGAAPPQPRKTHPVVWVVAILLIPLLGVMAWNSHREASLPPLPVNVKYRHALLGQGYVLVLRNTSGQSLQLMASLTHPSINDTRRFDVYIAPNGSTGIGRLNGWITQSGDRITLTNSNYQPWSGSIP